MRPLKNRISIILLLLGLSACGGPRIVPDRELARVFRDIYLTNSYVGQNNVGIDSLNIYEPIFAAYGYTSEDIQYTIGNFAKRKSARLSDVVEEAVGMLQRESRFYRRRVALQDTVAGIAREKYATVVHSDSLIRIRRVADTARLRIVIADIRPGSYEVSYDYLVDSLDRNTSLRANAWLLDGKGARSGGNSKILERGRSSKMTFSLQAAASHRSLVLMLGGYSKDLTTPNFTVDTLRVTYYLPEQTALRRFARDRYGSGTRLDSLLAPLYDQPHETHFVPPFADSARTRIR